MREYELINQEVGQIIAYEENGVRYSFPAIETNSNYQEYLRYTAWVEAGNNPEEFWSQSEDFLDTSVPEQPKEEGEG